jgi:hypothetical protein
MSKHKTVYGTKKMVFYPRIHQEGIELLLETAQYFEYLAGRLIAGDGENLVILQSLKKYTKDLENVEFVGPAVRGK